MNWFGLRLSHMKNIIAKQPETIVNRVMLPIMLLRLSALLPAQAA
jgi:hypothetical protein